jgi:hypothetical protein
MKHSISTAVLSVSLAVLGCSFALAQTAPAPAGPPAPPPNLDCPGAEYDQFNFMVGEWVAGPTSGDKRPAKSRWDSLHTGCSILENWMPQSGQNGYSINYYDQADKKWHQHWVDAAGDAVHYIGEWKNGKMEFRAEDVSTPSMDKVVLTMTFEPKADGSVRQSGTMSTDGGKTYQPSFDLTYQRPPK